LTNDKLSKNPFPYRLDLLALKKTLNLGFEHVSRLEEAMIIAPIVDGDDDNDGVLNSKDLCPESLPGAVVNENGCELDDDNDSVVNRLDKCPNTSEGVTVNADGCVATVNLNINFDTMSAKIKDTYNGDLADFANLLNANTELKATIEAHTDSKGSAAYNQRLSEKRAASAVNALEALNISGNRLQAIGYGETQPIATNDTVEGRAENRRVTALINQ
jgi:OOP family OmpA-OmpF porin